MNRFDFLNPRRSESPSARSSSSRTQSTSTTSLIFLVLVKRLVWLCLDQFLTSSYRCCLVSKQRMTSVLRTSFFSIVVKILVS